MQRDFRLGSTKVRRWLLACAALLSIACSAGGDRDRDREYVQAYQSLVRRFDHAVANIDRRLEAARREGFPKEPQAKFKLLVQLAADDAADFRELHEQATAIEAPSDFVPVHSAMVAYFDRFAKGMENTVQIFRSGRSETESEMQQDIALLRPPLEEWAKEAKNAGVLLPKDYRQTKP